MNRALSPAAVMGIVEARKDPHVALAVASPLPQGVSVSFEFFPPKTVEMDRTLWASILRLAPLNPAYVSVTYGAGGSTRERTHATVARILRETSLIPAAHLTCVGATREDIDAVARRYWDAGIRHIVALRGDAPDSLGGQQSSYRPHPGGYAFAVDLVKGLKKIADFDISVGAYPETHPEATDAAGDLEKLKRKVDAGASRAITQFFFDPAVFLRFRDRVRAAGIKVPLIPGNSSRHQLLAGRPVCRRVRGLGSPLDVRPVQNAHR